MTIGDAVAWVRGLYQAEGALDQADYAGPVALLARALGGVYWAVSQRIEGIPAQACPATATGPMLDAWGAVVGVTRRVQTYAEGQVLIYAPGSHPTILIPAGLIMEAQPTGWTYTVTDSRYIGPGDRLSSVPVCATSPGSHNLPPRYPLTIPSPPGGVDAAAYVSGLPIIGGEDRESDESYRARILEALRLPRSYGSESATRRTLQAALQGRRVSGVRNAWPIVSAPGNVTWVLDAGYGWRRAVDQDSVGAANIVLATIGVLGLTWVAASAVEQQVPITIQMSAPESVRFAAMLDVYDYIATIGPGGTVRVSDLATRIARYGYAYTLAAPLSDVIVESGKLPVGQVTYV